MLFVGSLRSEDRGPREAEHKAETSQGYDQNSRSLRHLLTPSALPAAPPIVNVYAGKHAGEESHCAGPRDWKEWGSFAACRSWEWVDPEKVIAIWTIILGGATFLLFLATRNLVKDAKNTGEHISRVERAYVYGGFGPQAGRTVVWFDDTLDFGVSLANYGKTPAFVIEVRIGFGRDEQLMPPEPDWLFTVPVSDYFFPSMTMKDVRGDNGARIRFPAREACIIFGEVIYRDVLGKIRWSRWAFRFNLWGRGGKEGGDWDIQQSHFGIGTPYWASSDETPKTADG